MATMHARFSRWIGPLPVARTSIVAWLVLAAIGTAILFVFVSHPVSTGAGLGALVLITIVAERKRTLRLLGMAQDRHGEDIGSFARSFNRRDGSPLDPWAIRCVWNALVAYTESSGRRVPLRPTDRFEDDLAIDPEDVEDLIEKLVEQCERVPGNWEANPFHDRLTTVGDLVHFISAQPLRATVRQHHSLP